MMHGRSILIFALGAAALFAQASVSYSQSVEEFYRGKQVRMVIGQPPGGSYNLNARLLANYWGKYIPGHPTIIPQNMPGASSLNAMNHIYNVAPRDGTVIGTGQRAVLLMHLLEAEGARFDARKLGYVGSLGKENTVCVSWSASGFKTIDDMRQREIFVSTSGAGAELTTLYTLLPKLLGVKLKVVTGYNGSASQELAMERGEIQGRCGISPSTLMRNKKEWLDDKKITFLLQYGLSKRPDLPDVPLLIDLAKDPQDKKVLEVAFAPLELAWPFFAPPDLPADRLAALRTAFDQTVKDPEFKEKADQIGLDLDPIDGQKMQGIINDLYKVSPAVLEDVKKLTNS
jgi:tripartite-type tricarboxylate transporter receptor subunit TctC